MSRRVCTFAGLLVVFGCARQPPQPPHNPDRAPAGTDLVPPQQPTATGNTPPARLSVAEYLAELAKDEDAARKKYLDKPLEVIGFYQSQLSGEKGGHIFLTATPATRGADVPTLGFAIGPVGGRTDPRMRALSPGQPVTVRGKVHWFNVRAVDGAEIVSVGPSTAVPTTLAEVEEKLGKSGGAEAFLDKDLFLRVTIAPTRRDGELENFSAVVAPKGSRHRYLLDTPLGDGAAKAALALAREKPGSNILVLARATRLRDAIISLEVRPVDEAPPGLVLAGKE